VVNILLLSGFRLKLYFIISVKKGYLQKGIPFYLSVNLS